MRASTEIYDYLHCYRSVSPSCGACVFKNINIPIFFLYNTVYILFLHPGLCTMHLVAVKELSANNLLGVLLLGVSPLNLPVSEISLNMCVTNSVKLLLMHSFCFNVNTRVYKVNAVFFIYFHDIQLIFLRFLSQWVTDRCYLSLDLWLTFRPQTVVQMSYIYILNPELQCI